MFSGMPIAFALGTVAVGFMYFFMPTSSLDTVTHSGLPAPGHDAPFAAWSTDDVLYEDKADDYVCNEPAIDFAAPLVFVLAELAEPSATGKSP